MRSCESSLVYYLGVASLLITTALHCGRADAASASMAAADWVGTWAAAGSRTGPFDPPARVRNDQTIRQIVRISRGGKRFRVRLSNVHGTAPLTIGAATIAPHRVEATVRAAGLRQLTFDGTRGVTLAAGAWALSDPVRLAAPDLSTLAISLYLPDGGVEPSSPVTTHVRALQTAYVAAGDQTARAAPQVDRTLTSWYYLTGVDVITPAPTPVIAVLGDSIANGDESTPDSNRRWPDVLAERIYSARDAEQGGPARAGVLNLGISGNQVTSAVIGESATERFDRDVLTRSGVSHVIIMAGINDLGLPGLLTRSGVPTLAVSAEVVIDGYRQLISGARAAELTVIGATLTPSGSFALPGYNTPEVEAKRQIINGWIRDGGAFDAVIDFDAVLRDPVDPARLRPDLTADGLHPNDAGYQAMAEAVPLIVLRPRKMGRDSSAAQR
ncbi:MAG: SGNH/GDSL hydrolase family protein [Pseudomonadota bacterium]